MLFRSIVNFAIQGQMKIRLQSYIKYFIDRKAPDGSDNGGVWPDDENLYSFKFEGKGDESKAGRRGSAEIRELMGRQSKASDEARRTARKTARKTAQKTARKTALKTAPTGLSHRPLPQASPTGFSLRLLP